MNSDDDNNDVSAITFATHALLDFKIVLIEKERKIFADIDDTMSIKLNKLRNCKFEIGYVYVINSTHQLKIYIESALRFRAHYAPCTFTLFARTKLSKMIGH